MWPIIVVRGNTRYKLVEDLYPIIVVSIAPEVFGVWLSKDIGQNIAIRFAPEIGFMNNHNCQKRVLTALFFLCVILTFPCLNILLIQFLYTVFQEIIIMDVAQQQNQGYHTGNTKNNSIANQS